MKRPRDNASREFTRFKPAFIAILIKRLDEVITSSASRPSGQDQISDPNGFLYVRAKTAVGSTFMKIRLTSTLPGKLGCFPFDYIPNLRTRWPVRLNSIYRPLEDLRFPLMSRFDRVPPADCGPSLWRKGGTEGSSLPGTTTVSS